MTGNYIFIDFIPSDGWTFKKEMEEKTGLAFDCIYWESECLHSNVYKTLKRYISYFGLPFRFIFSSKDEWGGIIVASQQFFGINYAFWKRLFRKRKTKKLIILTFIFKQKPGFIGWMYEKYVRFSINNDYIDAIICFSKVEAENYKKIFRAMEDKFYGIRFTIEDRYLKYKDFVSEKGFYLAVGRSNRDYDGLIECFRRMPERKLKIVCDELNIDNTPCNVEIFKHTYGDDYMKLLSECDAVILSLNKDFEISCGQLVMLQSMMMGKMLFATRMSSTAEYVCEGENGVLFSDYSDLSELLDKYEAGFFEEIKSKSREVFLAKFTSGVDDVARIVKGL